MFGLMVLALVAAAIFGGFYYWARRQGLVATEEGQPKGRISLLTEVVAYIGVILLLSGGVAAVGQQWNHFSAWGHVAAFAGAAAFLFLVGFILRGSREPAIQRLVSVLWFTSVACVAGAAGYLVHGVILPPAGPDGGATALSVGLAASLYAAALWLARRSAPQDLALFAGLMILICGIVAVAASGHTDAALLADALALWGFGLAWAWLGWRRYVEPMWLTVPLGALLALVAPSIALHPYGWMYATGIITAAAAMAISVPLRNTVFLGLGAVAMFGYVTGVVMTYFRESLGAPAALSITGALVIGVAAVTARLMRATRRATGGARRGGARRGGAGTGAGARRGKPVATRPAEGIVDGGGSCRGGPDPVRDLVVWLKPVAVAPAVVRRHRAQRRSRSSPGAARPVTWRAPEAQPRRRPTGSAGPLDSLITPVVSCSPAPTIRDFGLDHGPVRTAHAGAGQRCDIRRRRGRCDRVSSWSHHRRTATRAGPQLRPGQPVVGSWLMSVNSSLAGDWRQVFYGNGVGRRNWETSGC